VIANIHKLHHIVKNIILRNVLNYLPQKQISKQPQSSPKNKNQIRIFDPLLNIEGL
jgi:hypothetical protein